MRILTLNTWGTFGPPQRRAVLIDQIRAQEADLLCLQEVADEDLLRALGYPHLLHFPESQLALLSYFPILSHRSILYRSVPALERHPRGILLAELRTREAPFWVATTHLSWKPEDEPSRLSQVKELLNRVEKFPGPVLLSGDFNATPSDSPVGHVLREGFVDLFSARHQTVRRTFADDSVANAHCPNAAGTTWDNQNPFIQSHTVHFPDRRIDFLFLKNSLWQLETCRVTCNQPTPEGLYPSDHFGVLATLEPTQ